MKIFLVNKDKTQSYDTFLHDLNCAEMYYPHYRTSDLYAYFLNFISGLIHNHPLTLVDSDLNESEIINLGIDSLNVSKAIEPSLNLDINKLVVKVKESTSEITLFTSGTTGQPKKVIHSIQTLIRNVRESAQHSEQIWAYAYNPTHMAGMQVFFQAFLNLNTIVNVFNSNRETVYSSIEEYNITHISATPTFFRLLLPFENSYKSVVRVTLGGEKSDKKLYDSISLIFPNAKINNIYASTEAGSLFSTKDEFFQIPSSIKNRIKIQDNELYLHKSLLGKSDHFVFVDDYYQTGDLIEWVDEQESLFRFKGRSNELINVGGYKINPTEVENAIALIPEITQVVVYGKQNSVLGNILCADVQLMGNTSISELFIRDFLKDYLQDFKIPRRIKFVETMTLTRTGKIKRV